MAQGIVQKRPQSGEGHFSEKDYFTFVLAWSKSSLGRMTELATKYDPTRQDPFRVKISLLDKDADLLLEKTFEEGSLTVWRGNFHKWE